MLCELAVTDLGVIEDLTVLVGAGMTALTGETGAGKTLIVEALELLAGGRADSTMVRAGSDEAVVEARFVLGDEEVVLRRVVPRDGRSRAYVNGRLATASELADRGRHLIDLHGQHAHQSLLSGAVQRAALDRFAGTDLEPLMAARDDLASVGRRLDEMGGDAMARARELDLARFQLDELTAAGLVDPAEEDALELEEDLLASAVAHREAAQHALESLDMDSGAGERLSAALGDLSGRRPFEELLGRLEGLSAELVDVVADLRDVAESIEDDPGRLAQVRERRQLIVELRRKYGHTLADVITFRDELAVRVEMLENRESVVAALESEVVQAAERVSEMEKVVGRTRRKAAPRLAEAVGERMAHLGLDKARVEICIGDDPGDEVAYLVSTNPGNPPLPLAKVASGGELARAMLALRLVLSEAPDTLVFDEVDAGIGGAAALTVGRALAQLGERHQVLVVTHLAQVAAAADHQVVISKASDGASTTTTASIVEGEERVAELARMLSGTPESSVALDHAASLLQEQGDDASRRRVALR